MYEYPLSEGPCKKGETAAKTDCTPKDGGGVKQAVENVQRDELISLARTIKRVGTDTVEGRNKAIQALKRSRLKGQELEDAIIDLEIKAQQLAAKSRFL